MNAIIPSLCQIELMDATNSNRSLLEYCYRGLALIDE